MRNIERLKERAENMRMCPTAHEKAFAERLKSNGIRFKQQWVIGSYIVDFLIGTTIIEIDGRSHDNPFTSQSDMERTKYFRGRGFKVYRIRNENVDKYNIDFLKQSGKGRAQNTNIAKVENTAPAKSQSEIRAILERRQNYKLQKPWETGKTG